DRSVPSFPRWLLIFCWGRSSGWPVSGSFIVLPSSMIDQPENEVEESHGEQDKADRSQFALCLLERLSLGLCEQARRRHKKQSDNSGNENVDIAHDNWNESFMPWACAASKSR